MSQCPRSRPKYIDLNGRWIALTNIHTLDIRDGSIALHLVNPFQNVVDGEPDGIFVHVICIQGSNPSVRQELEAFLFNDAPFYKLNAVDA